MRQRKNRAARKEPTLGQWPILPRYAIPTAPFNPQPLSLLATKKIDRLPDILYISSRLGREKLPIEVMACLMKAAAFTFLNHCPTQSTVLKFKRLDYFLWSLRRDFFLRITFLYSTIHFFKYALTKRPKNKAEREQNARWRRAHKYLGRYAGHNRLNKVARKYAYAHRIELPLGKVYARALKIFSTHIDENFNISGDQFLSLYEDLEEAPRPELTALRPAPSHAADFDVERVHNASDEETEHENSNLDIDIDHSNDSNFTQYRRYVPPTNYNPPRDDGSIIRDRESDDEEGESQQTLDYGSFDNAHHYFNWDVEHTLTSDEADVELHSATDSIILKDMNDCDADFNLLGWTHVQSEYCSWERGKDVGRE